MDSLFIDNIRPHQRLLSVFGQLNMVVMHVGALAAQTLSKS